MKAFVVDSQELKEDPNLTNIKFSLFTEILNVSQVTSVTSQDLISEKKPGTVHFSMMSMTTLMTLKHMIILTKVSILNLKSC